MKRLLLSTVIFSCSLLLASESSSTISPSFDCSKATTSAERMICGNEELSQLDTKLSKIYKSFYLLTKEIKEDQRVWIKQRDKCQDSACIQKLYQQRVEELSASLSNQDTFPQTYLDAMKEAQESMEIAWDPIIFSKQEFIDAGLSFKDDLFRFKNITFKPPLIQNVQYNDPKLKKILGVCYYYRFDLEIGEFDHPKYIEDGRKYWAEDKRKSLRDVNISVWKTTAQDKEWFFIKPTNSGSAFLVDTALCKQERLKNNLVDALNYDRERVKRSHFGLDNSSIVTYKNQEYVFELSLIQNYRNAFSILNILGITAADDPTIRFTGGWVYLIPFKKIEKSQPQQGEK
jgi:uncharacterized protein YecT (DUF1311 family)